MSVNTFEEISPLSKATLAEMFVLITELAETALAVISLCKFATLAEMFVLITELAETALAVISPLSIATFEEIYEFVFVIVVFPCA